MKIKNRIRAGIVLLTVLDALPPQAVKLTASASRTMPARLWRQRIQHCKQRGIQRPGQLRGREHRTRGRARQHRILAAGWYQLQNG